MFITKRERERSKTNNETTKKQSYTYKLVVRVVVCVCVCFFSSTVWPLCDNYIFHFNIHTQPPKNNTKRE